MSIEKVSTEVKRFLADSEPEVLAIKGKWGVGKTYQWNELLKESRNKKSLKLYSYVSLFGVNSLEKLETEIALCQSDVEKSKNMIDTAANTATNMVKNVIDKVNYMGSSGITKAILFHSVEKTIICIDDLERRGKNLDLKDVLGLVSFLKENKKCKIVLLINDNEEGLEDFFKYGEKVIDNAILFSPTAEENFEIACRNSKPDSKPSDELTGDLYETALKYVTKLKITNIRILVKIKKLILKIIPEIKDFRPAVIDEIIATIVFFTWCYYSDDHDKTKPTLDFVLQMDTMRLLELSGVKDDSPEEEKEKWMDTIRAYGFTHISELDIILADMIKNGYVDADKFNSQIEQLNAIDSANEFHEVWKLYNNSFTSTEEEIIKQFTEKFQENFKKLSLYDLENMVVIFRELEKNTEADNLIDFYVKNRKDEAELFDIKRADVPRKITDQYIIKKCNERLLTTLTPKTFEEILVEIYNDVNRHEEYANVLANASEEEYYSLLTSNNGEKLKDIMSTYFMFKRSIPNNTDDKPSRIVEKFENVLKRIAGESTLNKQRISRLYGIEIN